MKHDIKPFAAPAVTRNTRLAAAWLVFGHSLVNKTPCKIYQVQGKVQYEFRFNATGKDAPPAQIEAWFRATGLVARLDQRLKAYFNGDGSQGPGAIKAQWGAYTEAIRRFFERHQNVRQQHREMEIPAQRIMAARLAIEDLVGQPLRDDVFLIYWNNPEGQILFEKALGDLVNTNYSATRAQEVWDMRVHALLCAMRFAMEASDHLHLHYLAAKEGKHVYVESFSNGRVARLNAFLDQSTARELRHLGGM